MTTDGESRSRRVVWLRDELILALDLYLREGRNPNEESVAEISALLRELPIEHELARDPRFRNPKAVRLKLYNFVRLDPAAETTGMTRGGMGDELVWDEFADDRERLRSTALAIRANMSTPPGEMSGRPEDLAEAPEGTLLTRVHHVRERSPTLVAARKAKALEAEGRLACEACGFDFAAVYGARGDGFIECHHTLPVSRLRRGARTRVDDLTLICSNCHRMIHRVSPWLTMDQLRALITTP